MREINEKFFHHLPEVLDKADLNSIEKTSSYTTMINLSNPAQITDFIFQNSKEINNTTKLKALSEPSLIKRLEILINLPNQRKIDQELNESTKKKIREEQEEYILIRKKEAIEKRLKKARGYGHDDMKRYLEIVDKNPYPPHIKELIYKKIEEFETISSNPFESNICQNYIE